MLTVDRFPAFACGCLTWKGQRRFQEMTRRVFERTRRAARARTAWQLRATFIVDPEGIIRH